MLLEDCYLKLLKSEERPEIPPGVLGNYEVALLYLQKFGIWKVPEEKLLELNPDAFGAWVQSSNSICLAWDIPELVRRIPERVSGNLYLSESKIQKLPNLREVEGTLNLYKSKILKLPKLERVGRHLNLELSDIVELPSLVEVVGKIWTKKEKLDYILTTPFFSKYKENNIPSTNILLASPDWDKKFDSQNIQNPGGKACQ